VCHWPVAADGLCLVHLLRQVGGFTEKQLDLPLGVEPEVRCDWVMDTGEVCDSPVKARGLCRMHYERRWRYGFDDERMGTPRRTTGAGDGR
jgi:hypothetical protein